MTKRQFEQELARLLKAAAARQKAKKPPRGRPELQGVRYTTVREHRRRVPGKKKVK